MKIYYAHPMSWYNTSREKLDMWALERQGEVANPSEPGWEERVQARKVLGLDVMSLFADFIRDKADVVAFRAFDDGKLGAGVAREVFEAIIWGKQVWQIFGKENRSQYGPFINKQLTFSGQGMYPLDLTLDDVLTVEETKARIARGQM